VYSTCKKYLFEIVRWRLRFYCESSSRSARADSGIAGIADAERLGAASE
jgi:hypothetical protein